eukprot:1858095-Pyramimonas_sp.AAC.1
MAAEERAEHRPAGMNEEETMLYDRMMNTEGGGSKRPQGGNGGEPEAPPRKRQAAVRRASTPPRAAPAAAEACPPASELSPLREASPPPTPPRGLAVSLSEQPQQQHRPATLGPKHQALPTLLGKQQPTATRGGDMTGISKEALVAQLKAACAKMQSTDPETDLLQADATFEKFYKGDLIIKLREMRPEAREKTIDEADDGAVEETTSAREERELWESLEAKGFKFSTEKKKGNPVAGRWDRVMKGTNAWADKYAQAEGYPAKRAVREEWARWAFTNWEKQRRFEKSTTNSKKQKLTGTYVPLARMARKLGGGAQGARMAFTYATKAIIMGGIWTRWCSMTDTLMYLFVE